jgi:hypothetical protein
VPFARAGLHIGQHCCYLLGAVFKRNPALSQIKADDAPPLPHHAGGGGSVYLGHGMFGVPHSRDAHPDPDDGGVWRHGDVIATLPEGARPTKKMIFACLANGCFVWW